jgi:hypothetical protein
MKLNAILVISIILFFVNIPIFTQEKETSKNLEDSKETTNPESKNQAEKRMEHRYSIQIGISRDRNPINNNNSIGFLFNYNKYITLGANNLRTGKKYQFVLPSYSNSVANINTNVSTNLITFFSRVYFFEKIPIYLSGGLGRDVLGKKVEGYFYDTFDNYFSLIKLTSDYKPTNFIIYGAGFNWIFDSRITLNLDLFQLKYLQKQNPNFHLTQVVNYPVSTSNIASILVFETIFENSSTALRPTDTYLTISIGYAF